MQSARDRCKELEASLPTIRSAEENQFIYDQIRNVPGISKWGVWIDAYRQADGKFAWGDDTPLDGHYTNWYGGEPNDVGGNEDCVQMYAKEGNLNFESYWNDLRCDYFMPDAAIMCQKEI